MKTKDEWKMEIAKVLSGKVDAVIERYQTHREQGFSELVEFGGQRETLEAEKTRLLEERAGLNLLKNADLKQSNLIGMRLPKLEKQLAAFRKKIDAVVARLTEVPELEPKLMNFLSEADFSCKPSYAEMIKKQAALQAEEEALREQAKNAS